MTSHSTLTGAAGEYYVLCQLLRHGWIAALAPKGVPNADIIVTDVEGNRQCAIQVKTRRDIGSDKGWHMSKKHEAIISPSLFYCFVDLGKNESDPPVTFIIPSSIVASTLKDSHQLWLDTPGKDGSRHNDTDMRRLLPDYARRRQLQPTFAQKFGPGWMEQYREKWSILHSQ
ncbi:hypothetical protein A3F36_01130 [Candidatus Peribacteria bacterium RIFCSPHIGHO2_12_FULL_55_11]|nr:MAG: hypothetical protein A3F36_01130 [Candidatus Peribacteria bacterium RIFCSPHIGHO2_12_FULL_55_11]